MLSLDGEEYQKQALRFMLNGLHFVITYPNNLRRTHLSTNEMLKPMFPNLCTLANVCISLPVETASVERSFSKMKMIKTRLRNRLSEKIFPT